MDVAGGKINIHVLMALAAFASVLMGNSLEGGLLLAMFNLAHIGKFQNGLLLTLVIDILDLSTTEKINILLHVWIKRRKIEFLVLS